jgi:hypothetical protein
MAPAQFSQAHVLGVDDLVNVTRMIAFDSVVFKLLV